MGKKKEKKDGGGKKEKEGAADATEGAGDDKKDAEKIVDGVEAKMREQMAELSRRQDLEKKRLEKVAQKDVRRKAIELKRIADYKEKVRLQNASKEHAGNERRLIVSTKEEERARAAERQKEEDDRLKNVREKRVLALDQKQLEYLMTH